MSESFSPEEIELMILENKITVDARQELFGVDRELLSFIINNVNAFNDIADKRARIVKKAAHLLGGISLEQPFKEGNRVLAVNTETTRYDISPIINAPPSDYSEYTTETIHNIAYVIALLPGCSET